MMSAEELGEPKLCTLKRKKFSFIFSRLKFGSFTEPSECVSSQITLLFYSVNCQEMILDY